MVATRAQKNDLIAAAKTGDMTRLNEAILQLHLDEPSSAFNTVCVAEALGWSLKNQHKAISDKLLSYAPRFKIDDDFISAIQPFYSEIEACLKQEGSNRNTTRRAGYLYYLNSLRVLNDTRFKLQDRYTDVVYQLSDLANVCIDDALPPIDHITSLATSDCHHPLPDMNKDAANYFELKFYWHRFKKEKTELEQAQKTYRNESNSVIMRSQKRMGEAKKHVDEAAAKIDDTFRKLRWCVYAIDFKKENNICKNAQPVIRDIVAHIKAMQDSPNQQYSRDHHLYEQLLELPVVRWVLSDDKQSKAHHASSISSVSTGAIAARLHITPVPAGDSKLGEGNAKSAKQTSASTYPSRQTLTSKSQLDEAPLAQRTNFRVPT